jgi:hypothetical protein
MKKLFQSYPARADCMLHDHVLIYISALTDILVAFLLILIGVLILTSKSKTSTTLINKPLGWLLVLLGVIFISFMITIWYGYYWVVAALKLSVWPLAVWTLVVLPRSIKMRKENDLQVQNMKKQLSELIKLNEEYANRHT